MCNFAGACVPWCFDDCRSLRCTIHGSGRQVSTRPIRERRRDSRQCLAPLPPIFGRPRASCQRAESTEVCSAVPVDHMPNAPKMHSMVATPSMLSRRQLADASSERAVPKTRPRIGPKSDPQDGSTDSAWNRCGGQIWGSIGGLIFPSQVVRCSPSSRRRQCSVALGQCASTPLQTGTMTCSAVAICGRRNCMANEPGIHRY